MRVRAQHVAVDADAIEALRPRPDLDGLEEERTDAVPALALGDDQAADLGKRVVDR